MPGRLIPLVTEEIYHIFNRGIDRRPTFIDNRGYKRAYLTAKFYQHDLLPVKLSKLLSLNLDTRTEIIDSLLKENNKIITIFSFCFMPNHFHFLVKQRKDRGISTFMSNFQNSYTRYFNTRQERTGPLFLDQFKAIRVETEEQFLHVCRYINLNPYTSFIIEKLESLISYPWSSYKEYIEDKADILTDTKFILSFFKNKTLFKQFMDDQADYQRELETIKHLLIE